jgi:hypothetical protein
VFPIVIDYAKKALVRRLAGNFQVEVLSQKFQEYVPFSLSKDSMEIPLSPSEEHAILNDSRLAFWGRISSDLSKCSETWIKLSGTRVKSIGIEMASGIKSIYFATEGIFPLKDREKTISIRCTQKTTDSTPSFAPKTLVFSDYSQVVGVFKDIKFNSVERLSLVPCSLSENSILTGGVEILSAIIDDPLSPQFSFLIESNLREYVKKSPGMFPNALEGAKRLLRERVSKISSVAAMFAAKVIKEFPPPHEITLSNVSFVNPGVPDVANLYLATLRSAFAGGEDENDTTRDLLVGFLEQCNTDADVWAMSMLLAKPDKLLDPLKAFVPLAFVCSGEDKAKLDSASAYQMPKYIHPDTVDLSQLGYVLTRAIRDDTMYLFEYDGMIRAEAVRAYNNPEGESGNPLIRIQTGGRDNMCPLLALGALREEDVRNILRQFEFDVDKNIGSIIQDSHIDYGKLWHLLRGDRANQQIEIDDREWWDGVTAALNARIMFYQENDDHMLVNSGGNGDDGAARVIHILARTAHYNMLFFLDKISQISREIARNAPYLPMF